MPIKDPEHVDNASDTASVAAMEEVVTIEEVEEGDEVVTSGSIPTPHHQPADPSAQLMLYDQQQAEQQRALAERLKASMQGPRRGLDEDDSQTAFGDGFAERFGVPDTMVTPSAPPLEELDGLPTYEDVLKEMRAWALAKPAERRRFSNNQYFEEFFKEGEADAPRGHACLSFDELPSDAVGQALMSQLRAASRGDELEASDTMKIAIQALLGHQGKDIDYRHRFSIYIPPELLALHEGNEEAAVTFLRKNELFDQIKFKLQESQETQRVSAWSILATQIRSGTLEIRMTAQGDKLMVLGEGYSRSIVTGGSEKWSTVAEGLDKDITFAADMKRRFEIIRVKPGQLGLIQRFDSQEQPFMLLLPGRYIFLQKFIRLIGISTLAPNENMRFVHPKSADHEVEALGRRFSAYQLQAGHGLFVDDKDGTFYIESPLQEADIFFFDNNALERPNAHPVDARERLLSSDENRYHIVRLQPGERIIIRGPDGVDQTLTYQSEYPELNTLHIPANYFTFDGKIHVRGEKYIETDAMSSVCLDQNDILVVRDNLGNIRFLSEFDPTQPFNVRRPFKVIDTISRMRSEYVYEKDDLKVARVRPSNNQWPVVYDQASGEIKLFPPNLEYVFSTAEGQTYLGMADHNNKKTQKFHAPQVGEITIATVTSGQIGMAEINNVAFLLAPSPQPYIIRSPNEFLGLVEKDHVLTHVPKSDLYRIYIPSGQWAVAMIDGKQVILDPAKPQSTPGSQGNGIWIFRAQELKLEGPKPINERENQLFNVQRIQVSMDEVAYGYNEGELVIWGPGNHVIDINQGERFEGFFKTKLDDISFKDFDVVWKHGVKGKIDVSVAFHIDGVAQYAVSGEEPYAKIKQAIALCGHDDVLRERIVENVKHHLLAAIAEMDPLGYGYTSETDRADSADELLARSSGRSGRTLRDLEDLFSDKVQETLTSYGVKVDNVTITGNNPDPEFIKRSEVLQQALMEAHNKAQQAELEKRRQATLQAQELQAMQAQTAQAREEAEQAAIKREKHAADTIREATAEVEAKAAKLQAEAQARLGIAKLNLEAAKLEADTARFSASAVEASGAAEMRVKELDQFGSLTPDQILELRRATLQLETARALVEGLHKAGVSAPGITQLALDPRVMQRMGFIEGGEAALQGLHLFAAPNAAMEQQLRRDDVARVVNQ